MVARQWNSCEYRLLMLHKIDYAYLATSLKMERTEGEMDNIV
jgi:hypothetical protein